MTAIDLETTLARVLGPGRPELSCEQCFADLDRYVDAEATGADPDPTVPGMAAHLEGCPACAEDYESLRDLVRRDARTSSDPGGEL